MDFIDFISRTFDLKLGGVNIEPTYWQAGAIILLLFVLVLTLARLRSTYVHWSLGKSAIAMIFWGFLLALILEGFLLIGGRTLLTEILGWENAPKPISNVLQAGRLRLVDVLGVTDEVPPSLASEQPTFDDAVELIQSLSANDASKLESVICSP